jgi:A/G-specific adenine glycosylase
MLQQTQANRVIDFFQRWMKEFPSWKALSEADQKDVLRLWKGLGYNSRALRLHRLAKLVREEYNGRLPQDFNELCTLPGIGPYTAGAIRAFAFNLWTPLIETNIRRVYIHHFFADDAEVSDKEIMEVITDMGPVDEPREWYEALMDYGAQLPKIVRHNPNVKSKHYTKQSRFEGSDRQLRGKILSLLLEYDALSKVDIAKKLNEENKRVTGIIQQLIEEEFLVKNKRKISLQ